jgi:hypothetical protein
MFAAHLDYALKGRVVVAEGAQRVRLAILKRQQQQQHRNHQNQQEQSAGTVRTQKCYNAVCHAHQSCMRKELVRLDARMMLAGVTAVIRVRAFKRIQCFAHAARMMWVAPSTPVQALAAGLVM